MVVVVVVVCVVVVVVAVLCTCVCKLFPQGWWKLALRKLSKLSHHLLESHDLSPKLRDHACLSWVGGGTS